MPGGWEGWGVGGGVGGGLKNTLKTEKKIKRRMGHGVWLQKWRRSEGGGGGGGGRGKEEDTDGAKNGKRIDEGRTDDWWAGNEWM